MSKKKKQDSWANLAQRLHVSRVSLTAWRKMPGAPATPDFDLWKDFVAENSLGIAGNRIGGQRETHLAAAVEKRNRLLDLEIAEKEGRMADRNQVNEMLTRVATLQKTILYAKLERELPAKAVGRTADEIARLGREFADELADIFARGIEEWRDAK